MSSKPEPQKSTRKTTGTRRRTPAEKKKQDGKSGRGTGVVSNETLRRRSEHIANLIGDTFWLFGLMVTIYFAITLASFDMNDPAWSRSVIADETIHNLGGLFGAYFADVGYYLFGLSVWWLVLAALVWLWKSFRPLRSPDSRPYSVKLAVAGLTVLLLGSPVLEYALWQQQLGDSLPTGAGGLAGLLIGSIFSHLLGNGGSFLVMLVIVLLAFSFVAQISWLDMLENIGSRLEWLWKKSPAAIRPTSKTCLMQKPRGAW